LVKLYCIRMDIKRTSS